MALIPYSKSHATAAQRIAHLCSRGLIVPEPEIAAREIELIGYERLRIYFLSRRQLQLPLRPFVPGTTYTDIVRLYACDTLIREASFAAVGQFELLLRNALSEALSDQFGSHPYYEASAFRDSAANLSALQTMSGAYTKSKDQRARHYAQTYSSPALPPIWTLKEFLTFGASVHVFKCLAGPVRTKVARQFGVPSDPVFISWLECLVDLRNMCAHHDRLFNRSFQKQPATLQRARVPTAPVKKIRAILECLDYLLAHRGAPAETTARVGLIIARYPEMMPSEAGFS